MSVNPVPTTMTTKAKLCQRIGSEGNSLTTRRCPSVKRTKGFKNHNNHNNNSNN
eukprot:CAMPEP_0115109020 /NCGR_PEP_ID=MMETSP0227-20121206/38393_1 /TAXON_ID=89957 /ORGANISM="Polarella glacialis, Strain CCMP 1383" /LENGTH=53 /DNA_ID=CAMNT_0002507511 /DNA_START=157 /DNA_END=315 /DNA_ORIENTATION=+